MPEIDSIAGMFVVHGDDIEPATCRARTGEAHTDLYFGSPNLA